MTQPRLMTVVLTLLLAPARGWADGVPAPSAPGAKPDKAPAPPLVRPATDAESKPLAEALAPTAKKKAPDLLQALTGLEGLQHADFVKPLLKLLSHEETDVAVRAAKYLELQRPTGADEKAVAKEVDRFGKDLWKNGYLHPVNSKRPIVKGAAVKVLGGWSITLDAKQFDEVRSFWARELGNPDPKRAGALSGVIAYVEATKDKRFCRLLAEQIDQPMAGAVNDASNPSAEYWEARWRLWEQIADPAIAALKAVTGQGFLTTADAKKWLAANEKTFGFSW